VISYEWCASLIDVLASRRERHVHRIAVLSGARVSHVPCGEQQHSRVVTIILWEKT
jgi:hypothetical protein